MKCNGSLNNPQIYKYYVTGSLEYKMKNEALQKMLTKIRDGGMNTFLNDSDRKKFTKNMREIFLSEGYINPNNTLTAIGSDIADSGDFWRGLQGAFFFTVLEYNGEPYLLDAELVDEKNSQNKEKSVVDFQSSETAKQFSDETEYSLKYRKICIEANWAKSTVQPNSAAVAFSFDYENNKCEVEVTWEDGEKEKRCNFSTTEESHFALLQRQEALDLLEKVENNEDVFNFNKNDTRSIQIALSDIDQVIDKQWLKEFYKSGVFSFKNIPHKDFKANIESVHLYIDQDDIKTFDALLKYYLFCKAERSYLGYTEVGYLVNVFQDLFVAPTEKGVAFPSMNLPTKEIYDDLLSYARKNAKTRPASYLHLQAFIDLSPADTIKPHIYDEQMINLTNQCISFEELVQRVFGKERDIEKICVLSKYTASNGRNARAMMLFAESVKKSFGIDVTIITTPDEVRPNESEEYRQSDKAWYNKMKHSNNLKIIEKSSSEIRDIHDRYYKVVRKDDIIEWWVMTGELDSLRFDKDNYSMIREDITIEDKGFVKEMTFSKIRQSGVPEKVVKIMEIK